jgi:hypothetical protein
MTKTRTIAWTEADTAQAREIWAEYQRQHDVSDRRGQAVGIDPISGRVWFGESAIAIREQLDEAGINNLLFFLRVGSDCYMKKRGKRSCLVM